ncbi:hypothetical protein PUNSTDRAFT_131922 [Punctularia strigosozonata HHB-11173 SS5]|uniref:uncharacterized protein n=1 Tax=Punctularia strigosozonata (strain HHB-11173) TaxID=741275 RepID=UPI0004417C0F|nr:uncharacterized protein PUNSTDRAFT_131922 [Punctularia strigosozonata HHB-11173 SS5]EIN11767.1 hypothetical protein PUNSTDRAFT_131922 [Punctularia strigosozonata HHB-11173 SS5]
MVRIGQTVGGRWRAGGWRRRPSRSVEAEAKEVVASEMGWLFPPADSGHHKVAIDGAGANGGARPSEGQLSGTASAVLWHTSPDDPSYKTIPANTSLPPPRQHPRPLDAADAALDADAPSPPPHPTPASDPATNTIHTAPRPSSAADRYTQVFPASPIPLLDAAWPRLPG